MKYLTLALALLSSIYSYSAALTIMNDAPFPIHASIVASTGKVMGSISIEPQKQMTWQDSNVDASGPTLTPYTVIFLCPDGSEYGVYSNAPQSGYVSVSSAQGKRFCQPKKKGKDGKEEQNPRLPEVNAHQWSQDART